MLAEDILLIDGTGQLLDGRHTLEPTAFFIHSWIHRLNPRARCVMHTHMPYATALTLGEGGRLAWCNQNALRFHGRIADDDDYNGLALEETEGRRIASMVGDADVVFMASHGVTVVAPTVAWAFDELYYLERACMHQALAQQQADGRPLRTVPQAICEQVARQITCAGVDLHPKLCVDRTPLRRAHADAADRDRVALRDQGVVNAPLPAVASTDEGSPGPPVRAQ